PKRDYATSLPCEIIARDNVRTCAELIARTFGTRSGTDDAELNLAELEEAEVMLGRIETGGAKDDARAKELVASGVFTRENISALGRFMRDGLGPLLRRPAITINDRVFDEVYRVPVRLLKDGQESQAKDATKEAIKKVERLVGDASFD